MNYQIIMADMVKSREKSASFMEPFNALVDEANREFKGDMLSPLTITLGDEFQGVVRHTPAAFFLLFYLNEKIIEKEYDFQLRFSLVYGAIDTPINQEVAYNMYGAGLTRARESLQTIKETGESCYIRVNPKVDEMLRLSMRLYFSITAGWKRSDFQKITAFLQHDDYKVLKELGLYRTTSGAWKKRKSLQIDEYNTVKQLVTEILQS